MIENYKSICKLTKYFVYFIVLSCIAFFGVQEVQAYYQKDLSTTQTFMTAIYDNLTLSTNKTTYGLCDQNASIILTIYNSNEYNVEYTISLSDNNLEYTIDGAVASSYIVSANGSKTHMIVVSGTTSTTSLSILVNSNGPYSETQSTTVTLDLTCPVCTWGGVNSTNQYLKNETSASYTISCTDTSGIATSSLTSSAFSVADSSLATITGVTTSTITNGYAYTVTVTGKTGNGNTTLSLNANAVNDGSGNNNVKATSDAVIIDNTPPTITYSEPLGAFSTVYGDGEYNMGYRKGPIYPTVTLADSGSGIDYVEIWLHSVAINDAVSGGVTDLGNGVYQFNMAGDDIYIPHIKVHDNAGNISVGSRADGYHLTVWNIDNTVPTISYNLAEGIYNTTQTITVTPSDTNGSGVNYYRVHVYKNGTQVGWYDNLTSANYSVTLSQDATWTVYTYVVDNAGNIIAGMGGRYPPWNYRTYVIDTTAPTITYSQPLGSLTTDYLGSYEMGNFQGPIYPTVTLADSGSGINYSTVYICLYSVNSNSCVTNGVTDLGNGVYQFNMTGDDIYIPHIRVYDNAGNVSAGTRADGYHLTVWNVDITAPTCAWSNLPTGLEVGSTATLYLTCTDSSGIETTALISTNFTTTLGYSIDNVTTTAVTNGYRYNITVTGTSHGNATISLNAGSVIDNAANTNIATSGAFTIKKTIYITFNINGAGSYVFNGTTYTSTQTLVACTLVASGTCDISAPTIARSGYTPCGWSPTATTPTSVYRSGTTITLSSSGTTLYAITGKLYNNLLSSLVTSGTGLYNVDAFAAAAEGVKYMYRGANPNNYIYFNCSNEAAHSGCQTWRILSIEKTALNGSTYTIEIVHTASTLTSKWNNTSTTSYWFGSSIKEFAENTIYGGMYAGSKSRIVSAYYYNKTLSTSTYGGTSSTTLQATAEQEVLTANPYYIGIPRVTDYLITSSSTAYNSKWSEMETNELQTQNNWMRNTTNDYWFISKATAEKGRSQTAGGGGVSGSKVGTTASLLVYPVVHLNSNVFLLGSGTSGDPYYVCPACTSTSASAATCGITVSNASTYEPSKNLTLTYYANGTTASATPYSWSFSPNWTASNNVTMSTAGTIRGYVMDSLGATNSCAVTIVSRAEYQHQTCSSCKSCNYCSTGVLCGTRCYYGGTLPEGQIGTECNDDGGAYNSCNGKCYYGATTASYGTSCGYCGCNTWNTSDTTWYTNSCGTSNYSNCKNMTSRTTYAQG